ncbi:MAG: site-specific integrase [Solirubrobacteraceae bacterium]
MVDEVLERAQSWRAPTREPGDGPPGPDELLLIVLRHYQRRSENTRALYARELVLYVAHCQSRGQDPHAVRAEQHIEDYLALLKDAGLAEASRALALAALVADYHRAVHERAIDQDPCAIVERPRPAASEQNHARALSRPQAAQLLAAARPRSALHELLVCLLFFNGLRVSKAAGADVEDLSEHQGPPRANARNPTVCICRRLSISYRRAAARRTGKRAYTVGRADRRRVRRQPAAPPPTATLSHQSGAIESGRARATAAPPFVAAAGRILAFLALWQRGIRSRSTMRWSVRSRAVRALGGEDVASLRGYGLAFA